VVLSVIFTSLASGIDDELLMLGDCARCKYCSEHDSEGEDREGFHCISPMALLKVAFLRGYSVFHKWFPRKGPTSAKGPDFSRAEKGQQDFGVLTPEGFGLIREAIYNTHSRFQLATAWDQQRRAARRVSALPSRASRQARP